MFVDCEYHKLYIKCLVMLSVKYVYAFVKSNLVHLLYISYCIRLCFLTKAGCLAHSLL